MHTELRVPRRRRGQNSAQTPKDLIEAVRVLARICSDDLLASTLNRNGLLTGRGNRWTRERVDGAPDPSSTSLATIVIGARQRAG